MLKNNSSIHLLLFSEKNNYQNESCFYKNLKIQFYQNKEKSIFIILKNFPLSNLHFYYSSSIPTLVALVAGARDGICPQVIRLRRILAGRPSQGSSHKLVAHCCGLQIPYANQAVGLLIYFYHYLCSIPTLVAGARDGI